MKSLKKMLCCMVVAVLLVGCTFSGKSGKKEKYQATFFTVFDTVTTIIGYAQTEEEFQETANMMYQQLEQYHRLFDIYQEYEGINNLKTINQQAGIAPVKVEKEILDLLLDCRKYYEWTDGRVNVAMGSVLQLWHEARQEGLNQPNQAFLPNEEKLKEAAKHCSFETIIIDEEQSTVYITDSMQQLDVGAIAKGWAVEQVGKTAPEGFLISVGGNVRATGAKPQGNSPWVVGIESPEGDNSKNLHTVSIEKESVVTSGDYQRYYEVDGKKYHHLIDTETLYPAERWKSVSVICNDSGLGDALSTALFFMSKEKGQELLDQCGGYAMWVVSEDEIYYSMGFKEFIKN